MARPSTRKRRRNDDKNDDGPNGDGATSLPRKHRRVSKPTEAPPRDSASWIFLPAFYDSLPSIYLTRRALDEFNRRTRLADRKKKAAPARSIEPPARSLTAFSRHGGPDLSDLRGYAPPTKPPENVVFTPGAGPAPRPPTPGSGTSASIAASSSSSSAAQSAPKSRMSSAYDANFEQHMTEFLIFNPARSTRPPDLAEVVTALHAPPPNSGGDDADNADNASGAKNRDAVTEDDFAALQAACDRIRDEDDVVASILPLIAGPSDWIDHAPAHNVLFKNMAPLTNNAIVTLKPDLYYGAPPEQLAPNVRAVLGAHIVPTTAALDRPLLPNFFVEFKGPNGTDAVALRQVRYDGAVGARAMHSLQNYAAVCDGVPPAAHIYDGRIRTLSATVFGDMLRVFGHHVTAPAPGTSRPTYHISRLGGWLLSDDFEQFRQGVLAFRGARDMARRFRDELIAAANLAAGATVAVGELLNGADHTAGRVNGPPSTEPLTEPPAEPAAKLPADPPAKPPLKRPRDAADSKNAKQKPPLKNRRRTGKVDAATEAGKAKK